MTGLVGWLLSELSHRRREVASDRRAISRALADLLEIRHQTFGIKAYLDEVTKQFKLPNQIWTVLRPYIESLFPSTDLLQKRYNDAVDCVASANPLLGFRLRSKEELPRYLRTVRQLATQDPSAADIFPTFEARLLDVVKSPLDEIILELARIHGWRTWWRVRKLVREPIFDKKDFDEIFSKFQPFISVATQQTDQITPTSA